MPHRRAGISANTATGDTSECMGEGHWFIDHVVRDYALNTFHCWRRRASYTSTIVLYGCSVALVTSKSEVQCNCSLVHSNSLRVTTRSKVRNRTSGGVDGWGSTNTYSTLSTYNFTFRHPFNFDDNAIDRINMHIAIFQKMSLSAKFVAYLEVFIRLHVSWQVMFIVICARL